MNFVKENVRNTFPLTFDSGCGQTISGTRDKDQWNYWITLVYIHLLMRVWCETEFSLVFQLVNSSDIFAKRGCGLRFQDGFRNVSFFCEASWESRNTFNVLFQWWLIEYLIEREQWEKYNFQCFVKSGELSRISTVYCVVCREHFISLIYIILINNRKYYSKICHCWVISKDGIKHKCILGVGCIAG